MSLPDAQKAVSDNPPSVVPPSLSESIREAPDRGRDVEEPVPLLVTAVFVALPEPEVVVPAESWVTEGRKDGGRLLALAGSIGVMSSHDLVFFAATIAATSCSSVVCLES